MLGLLFAFFNERLKGPECDIADVMFDAFSIELGLVGWHSDVNKKINDGFMSSEAPFSEFATRRGQLDRLARDNGNETFSLKAIKSFCDGRLRDTESLDKVGCSNEVARFRVAETVNQLDVIFGDFGLVIFSSTDKGIFFFCH